MKIERTCKTCASEFEAIKETQLFCCRKCFRQDYYARKKQEAIEKNQNPTYPEFCCTECGRRSPLGFDPLKNMAKYDEYRCPFCNYSPRWGWDNRNQEAHKRIVITFVGIYTSVNHPVYMNTQSSTLTSSLTAA